MSQEIFRAPTMGEAIAQVKRKLGRDAVILDTRSVRKGWLWWGHNQWEVTASPNVPPQGRYAPVAAPEAGPSAASTVSQDRPSDARVSGKSPPAGKKAAAASAALTPTPAHLAEEVSDIRRMLQTLMERQPSADGAAVAPPLRQIRLQLLQQEISPEIVEDLLAELHKNLTGEQLNDSAAVHESLIARLSEMMPAAPPLQAPRDGRPAVAAFIGPTGVGKTTTIAKIAANFKLRAGKKVGMVTIDTYRIAAVDQLKTYAEIVDVPLQVVLTPGELRQAVESMADYDLILIDTAGRSQYDRLRLGQLSGFLKAVEPTEIFLVVAATAGRSSIVATLERFVPLGVNRIIMSKLDEATALGAVVNVANVTRMPISYVTTGQDVPDDISPADPAALARCIVEGKTYVAR